MNEIERCFHQFGYANVIVVLKQSAALSTRSRRSQIDEVKKELLPSNPEPAAEIRTRRGTQLPTPSATKEFPNLGVVVGYADQSGLNALSKKSAVQEVLPVEQVFLIRPVRKYKAKTVSTKTTWGISKLNIEKLWEQGLTGTGIKVGHLDTGIDGKHPALKNRIVGWQEFDFDGEPVPNSSPHDTEDHGTHTAGTICGDAFDGLKIGVAPKVDLYSALVIEGGKATLRVLAGLEWMITVGVQVISMSLGFSGYTPFFQEVVRRIRDRGILSVFAIGNEGIATSRSPGNYPEPVSVGAMDEADRVAWFSSSQIFQREEDPNQPNVIAPGVNVISAQPGDRVQAMDGTSMATPHVAAVAALLLEAKPSSTVVELEQVIFETCEPLSSDDPPNRYGYGLVNPVAAFERLTGTELAKKASRKSAKKKRRI
jgi:subtilisin